MAENNVLISIDKLHRKIYELVQTLAGTIPEARFMGFESSRVKEPLPTVGIAMNLSEISVDRNRPTPQMGHRIFKPNELKDYELNGEIFHDVPVSYTTIEPLPVLLTYEIDTWCHEPIKQLQMDHALLKLFPERGVLVFEIDSVEYELPIALVGIDNLDDLRENFRERLYRYTIEAWTEGNIPESLSQTITAAEFEIFKEPEETQLDLFKIEAEVQ